MKYGFVSTIGDLKRMIADLDDDMPVLMNREPLINHSLDKEYKTGLIPTIREMKKENREYQDFFDGSIIFEEIYIPDPQGQECFLFY
jgi:hypothetical protein